MFNVRIAASGRSTSSFSPFIFAAHFAPRSSAERTLDGVIVSSDDSSSEQKNDTISAIGALDDLAEALPVHSFATEVALAEGKLRLAGRTYDLPDVLTALESSGRFADSALIGPAVRGEDERSSLFTLETRPLIRSGGELK